VIEVILHHVRLSIILFPKITSLTQRLLNFSHYFILPISMVYCGMCQCFIYYQYYHLSAMEKMPKVEGGIAAKYQRLLTCATYTNR
jgi:hypothetical protein